MKRKLIFILVFLLFIAIINFTVFRNNIISQSIRSGFINILYPFQFLTSSAVKSTTSSLKYFIEFKKAAYENKYLKQQLLISLSQLKVKKELEEENQRLRHALSYKSNNPYNLRLLPALVIGRSPDSFFKTIQINKGSQHGIKVNQAIISSNGLVGKTVSVSTYTSQVLLIIGAESAVSAIDQRTRDFGVVEGAGQDHLIIKYIPVRSNLSVNDYIVTSGLSQIFPKGIIIGTVKKIKKRDYDIFQYIEIEPSVDFSKLEEVFVVL